MDSITSALRNLESRLALALDSAAQAQADLNAVRMRAGMGPIQYFHLSAAIAETKVGAKGGTRLTAEQIVNAGRFTRNEAPLRLVKE
jgi:hypothetical protein